MLTVDGDAVDTLRAQDLHHVLQPGDGLEDTLGDDRFHHVELQLTCLGSKGHSGVVADHFEANLVRYFRNNRVHFARHDGTTRSHRRQVDLMQAATRTGSHQTQVITHLTQFNGQALERSGIADVRTCIRSSLNQVAG